MKIKINPLTVIVFAIVSVTGGIRLYAISYCLMALHEAAHLAAAKLIGLRAEKMTVSPFGLHLTLDCKIVNSFADEVILYLAGPLVNAVFALVFAVWGYEDLYRLNTVLFVMNILPFPPLDGGMIAVRIISRKIGRKSAYKMLAALSVTIGIFLLVTAGICAWCGHINPSLFMLAVLFIGNAFTGKELYDTDFINAISYGTKHSNKARVVIIDDMHPLSEALKGFSPSYTTLGVCFDKNGTVTGVMAENEMIDKYRQN